MSSERLKKAGELFLAALEQPPELRSNFLKQSSGDDAQLLEEAKSLLLAHEKAEGFMKTSVAKSAASQLFNEEEQLAAGQLIGSYRIIREIGKGGMGAVYLAERADQQYKKQVAIKLIKRGMDTQYVLQHFRNERQILANFDHPNIARLLDGGSTESGLPYFAMEYVEGKPIDEYCNENRLNITQRLELFQKVCDAVSYAHHHLVIHRDIKPSNILVTEERIPKLLDFGIAKILQSEADSQSRATATNIHAMTPEFASPEQVNGISVTTASDVYSLGVVLYELLTGSSPYLFTNRSPIEIARVITSGNLQMPSAVITEIRSGNQDPSSSTLPEGNRERLRHRLRGDLDNIVLMAMRREPERRYQSVEQFSQDIQRHLNGLPVIARKDTFSYRASKFVQRNKIAVSVAVLAILAVIVSLTVAGIIQWRANQQAKFLQEFGAEAARIEGIMRFAYLMHLHDTSPERQIVSKRIQAINARMNELGRNAQGPGHYAIGRAFMALQKYEDAQHHFKQALDVYAYRTPELAYSYGLTLAMLYQTELQTAIRINSKELREKRMKEIQRDYKDPALTYIQEGRHSTEYSAYAEGLVDFLDEHYEQTIQRTEKVMQQIPWFYESKRLEGEAYRIIGRQSFNTGNDAQALDSYTKADKAFEVSIQKGPSDALGYIGLCTLKTNILYLQLRTGGSADVSYRLGKDICQKALQADPKNASAYLAFSNLHRAWAENYTSHERIDRQPTLDLAIQAAQKSILLQPQNSETHKALGMAYSDLAREYMSHEIDPSKAVAIGKESFAKAIQINPNDTISYVNRAWLLWYLAEYLRVTGADPRKTLDDAYQSVQTAIKLDPKFFAHYHAAGYFLQTRGAYQIDNGLDPNDSLDSAFINLQKSIQLNPGHMPAYIALGTAALIKGEYLYLVGQDPFEPLNLAEDTYRKALRINPNLGELFKGIAHSNWRKGQYTVETKKDPTVYLEQARSIMKKALEADSSDRDAYAISGQIELVAARWKMLQHKNPEQEIKSALRWENLALEVSPGPDYFDAWYSKAQVYQRWAEWELENKKNADNEIRVGLEMVDTSLRINPRSAEMIGTRGIFLLFQARSVNNLSQRKAFAEKAQTSFHQTLKLDANLSHVITPYLTESEQLLKLER